MHAPPSQFTGEHIQIVVVCCKKLKMEFSARMQEIQGLMDPWEIEAQALKDGKRKFEGRWLSSAEWDRERGAREGAAKEAFLKTIRPPNILPTLIGQGTVVVVLATGAAGLFFGISFLFHGILEIMRRRAWWKGLAWLVSGLLVVGVISRTTGLVLATPDAWEMRADGDSQMMEDLLWSTTGQKNPFPREIEVTDKDLNSWWSHRLQAGPLSVMEILVVGVESWRIQFLDGGLRLERVGKLLGRRLVLRHEMSLRRTEKGEEIYRIEGYLGKMTLPPAVVLRSWGKWMEDVAKLSDFFSAPKGIRLERLEKGRAVFSAPLSGGGG